LEPDALQSHLAPDSFLFITRGLEIHHLSGTAYTHTPLHVQCEGRKREKTITHIMSATSPFRYLLPVRLAAIALVSEILFRLFETTSHVSWVGIHGGAPIAVRASICGAFNNPPAVTAETF
jgi:hypothetical protein